MCALRSPRDPAPCAHGFTLYSRVCTTTPYICELCKGLHHHNVGSGTSPHVLRFTDFDHRRERRRLEYVFLTNAAATVRSVGLGAVCE
jgi:hypothetical protein